MARLSGLQRDVLALYRRALRLARARGDPALAGAAQQRVREGARRVSRRDVQTIEHMLRTARKQLDLVEESSGATRVTLARGGAGGGSPAPR
eukprot:PRCOL_00002345-RA